MDCCAGIICDGEDSLGLKLVNAGYDLWMNNSRGNRYSKDHAWIELETCTKQERDRYWRFSFSELGRYDQPALWDFVLAKTGQEKLTYIGHSQGTSQMFAALCEMPEFFRPKMKCFIAMAPVLRISNLTSPRIIQMRTDEKARKALELVGPELFWRASSADFIAEAVVNSTVGQFVNHKVMKDSSDDKPELISPKGLENLAKFFPAGCSYQQLNHFRQISLSGDFQKYDYGSEELNIEMYGQAVPPMYNLDNISGFNITLVCGKTDHLASKGDYDWVAELLRAKNTVTMQEFEEGHLGVVMPADKEVGETIFKNVIE